jgi:hypothetical protein
MIVARHEVPGKRPPNEPSRRVRYDRPSFDNGQETYNINFFGFPVRKLATRIIESVRAPPRIRPYPTGRLFWWCTRSRHFVSGYDHTVPPGHFARGFN